MSFDRDQVEARLALSLIASAEMPRIAMDALEAGFDGPATLRLAVLGHPTYFEVAELLPRVMQELGLAQIATGQRRPPRRKADCTRDPARWRRSPSARPKP